MNIHTRIWSRAAICLLAGVAITYGCAPAGTGPTRPSEPIQIQAPLTTERPPALHRFDTGNDDVADLYIMEFTDSEGNHYLIAKDVYGGVAIEPIPSTTD